MIVQVPDALAIAPPINLINCVPMVAVKLPPQVVVGLADAVGVPTITKSPGRESLILIPLTPMSEGAVIVILNLLVAPGAMGLVLNVLLT